MEKVDYFIASRFRNHDAVLELADKLRAIGKSLYCFIEQDHSQELFTDEITTPEAVMQNLESIPDWRNDPQVRNIFETDMNGLRSADTLILLLPAGKSAHLEAGTAYGLGKKLILIGDQQETETLYLIFDEVYPSIDAFIGGLS